MLFHTQQLKTFGYHLTIFQGLLSKQLYFSIIELSDINIEFSLHCHNYSGTAIYANLWAVMHDKYYWKDPHEFRPERFLDNDGQFRRDDRCVPFSLGKRYCIGQVI